VLSLSKIISEGPALSILVTVEIAMHSSNWTSFINFKILFLGQFF